MKNATNHANAMMNAAMSRDLNGKGWLKTGFTFFVKEIEADSVQVLVERTEKGEIDLLNDSFPAKLEMAWEDYSEAGIKTALIAKVGYLAGSGAWSR